VPFVLSAPEDVKMPGFVQTKNVQFTHIAWELTPVGLVLEAKRKILENRYKMGYSS
jgi:hypothetical protein